MSKSLQSKATINDVAKMAGVSKGTVSRVINNRDGVHTETRLRILQIMEELGYKPQIAARELSFSAGKTVGLNNGYGFRSHSPFFSFVFETLLDVTFGHGYRFRCVPTDDRGIPSSLCDAFILFGPHLDDQRFEYLRKRDIPFVVVGRSEEYASVISDNYAGGYAAGKHLEKLGHKRILHVAGSTVGQEFLDRYTGFRDALAAEGIDHDPHFLLNGHDTSLGGYLTVKAFLEKHGKNRFSAVFANSDEIALGVTAALEDAGLRVPLDVSVVGFDDLPEMGKDLTTIRQDIPGMCKTIVDLIEEQMSGRPSRHVIIPTTLVVRSTSSANLSPE